MYILQVKRTILHYEEHGGREYCTVQQACNKLEDSHQLLCLLRQNDVQENFDDTCCLSLKKIEPAEGDICYIQNMRTLIPR